jgi:hypothetical protein
MHSDLTPEVTNGLAFFYLLCTILNLGFAWSFIK